jgi:hypothetical protein
VVNPTLILTFGTAGFTARVLLLTADHADDRKVASIEFSVIGGKWVAGAGNTIDISPVTVVGDPAATFSNVVTLTATTATITKSANVATGNYGCYVYVEVVRGTLSKLTNGNTMVDIVTFNY